MHDPMTVAHEIRWPWADARGYRAPLLTVWHVDPESDGTDDSAGWFLRARHCDQAKLAEVARRFASAWTHGVPRGWFDEGGAPNYSTIAIALGMFRIAADVHFGPGSAAAERFLRKHCFGVLHFAENSSDSLYTFIDRPYRTEWGPEDVAGRAGEAARIVYPWICRAVRPWWRHPRWAWWRWKFQLHPWQDLKRRYWDRCRVCGKRGFPPGVSACGSWSGDEIWHSTCDARRHGVTEGGGAGGEAP